MRALVRDPTRAESLVALGVSIVANFQELAVFKVHLAGAIMAFGVGSLYMWTQVGFMVAYQKRVYIYEM